MDVELDLFDVGLHELCELVVFGDFQMADEFVEDHLVFDGLLTAGDGHRVHYKFEGDLSGRGGTWKDPS
jgi:hypothetical protein